MARRWTARDDRTLRALNKKGATLGAVCRETGWSAATVSRRARALGLTWANRVPTEMVAAQAENIAAVRADVLAAMWEQAQAMLGRLAAPEFVDLVRGEYGVEHLTQLSTPPSRSLRDLTSAISNLTRSAAAIESAAKSNADSSDIRAFLTFMAGANVGQDSTTSDIGGENDASGSAGGVPPQPA